MSFNTSMTISKLKSEILKKKKPGLLTVDSPQIAELNQLWENCTDPSPVVCHTSCQALLDLVCAKEADFSFVLNNFLNFVPSARNLSALISTVGELLVLQALVIEQSEGTYVCPYGIRIPPHPFISICTNRPECWPHLQQQVILIYNHASHIIRRNALKILQPFLKYILLDPTQNQHYLPLRFSLQRQLVAQLNVDGSKQTDDENLIDFNNGLFPCFQVSQASCLAEAISFVLDLLSAITSGPEQFAQQFRLLMDNALSLCHLSLKKDLNTILLTKKISALGHRWPESLNNERNIILLGKMLMEVYADITLDLLHITQLILNTETVFCPVVIGCLTLPVLQLLMDPNITSHDPLHSATTSVIESVEKLLSKNVLSKSFPKFENCLSADAYECQSYVFLCHKLNSNPGNSLQWLVNLQQSLDGVPILLTNLVTSLFVTSQSIQLSCEALQVMTLIAEKDTHQALNLLPVLLYQMGREANPEMKFHILKAIPTLAQHKSCVGPILKTLQMLGSFPKLKPISIQLLTCLWRLQDRCFIHLHKLLTDGPLLMKGASRSIDELLVSKAASIQEICKLRPVQHGPDMLSFLSEILNECTDDTSATAVAMALDGLSHLCEAEVIDVQSVWKLLSNRLSNDKRTVVIIKICEMFSLVPGLAVGTEAFEKFSEEVVSWLWSFTQNSDVDISTAAFKALSVFSVSQFNIRHLPAWITEDFCQQAENILQNEDNPNVTLETLLSCIPGVCFNRLLLSLKSPKILDGYQTFLNSMVATEVRNLPRGMYHSSYRKQGEVANQNRAISSVPDFILKQYERTKQPGLRPGLAVGLLFCYDPPVEVSQDGQPRRHYTMAHGKRYQQMLSNLLHEVPIQPSEWHRCMLMPFAWTSFMDRLFKAMIASRKAEIETQYGNEQVDEEESKYKEKNAWLWVRDVLIDMIKGTSRGNPTMQGNSILALGGLISAVTRYGASGEDAVSLETAKTMEHRSHSHWLTVALDTIMFLWDINFEPKGDLLRFCQQTSAEDRNPCSLLGRASACLAMSQVVSGIIGLDPDRIYQMMAMLASALPHHTEDEDGESPVITFHTGLALGMLLAQLHRDHFSDVCGTKGMIKVWKYLENLEESCMNETFCNRSGAILGLGLALCALSEEGKTDLRVHVISQLDKLFALVQKTDTSHETFQALCVTVACVTSMSFASNIIQVKQLNSTMVWLHNIHEENPQLSGVCVGLGTLCYSLGRIGYTPGSQLSQHLATQWMKNLLSEESAPPHRVAAFNGLMALIGSERTLVPVQEKGSLMAAEVNVSDVIRIASNIVRTGEDLGIQRSGAWMLGHLYLSACEVAESRASVPTSYYYMDKSSFLRSLIDFLLDAGKSGPEQISAAHVELALTAVQVECGRLLPPINWARVLSPLMRLQFGTKVQTLCLKLAIAQSSNSQTAALFLSSWLNSALFISLQDESREVVYTNLPVLIKCQSVEAIGEFLEHGCMEPFVRGDERLQLCVLQGLNSSLMVRKLPQAVTELLYKTVAQLYSTHLTTFKPELYDPLCDCLSNIPDEMFDRITLDDFQDNTRHLKGTYVRCFLVGNGKQPIALLNSCIDATLNSSKCNRRLILNIISHCFYRCMLCKNDFTGVLPRMQWLLEFLGHVKNLATEAVSLSKDVEDPAQVFEFGFQAIACSICLWTSPSTSAVLGFDPHFMRTTDVKTLRDRTNEDNTLSKVVAWDWLKLLPGYVTRLENEPWRQILGKVIDWMLIISRLPDDRILPKSKQVLRSALYMLRHTSEFQKAAVWKVAFA